MVYLFASDFDNTFYFKDGFHKSDIDSIHAFQNEGHLFGLSTGRSYHGIIHVVKDLIHFDFFLLVTGSYLLDKDKNIIYQNPIASKTAKTIFDKYKDEVSIAINTGERYIPVSDSAGAFKEEIFDYPSDEAVFRVSCSCKKKEDVPFYKEKIEKEFSSLTAHQNGTFFDITNKKCSKGNSIDILRKQYENPFVFGIGDNYNDITLLDSADVSFTFTYSDEEVKKHAEYIVNNIKEAIDIALKIISESE